MFPWRQWLRKSLAGSRRRPGRRPTFRLTLEALEERTLLSAAFPFVQSINRLTPTGPLTSAATVSYAVTFSEPVTGVDPTDFKLVSTGTVGTTLTQVTPVSQSVYTVTVSGITGNGTLGLNLVDDGSIRDLAGNPLTQQNAQAPFNIGVAFPTGAAPKSVVLGDVNGDGEPDLIVANYNSNTVSVLLDNGNGTFKAQQTVATGVNPVSVALGDVNGDGKPDLVVANLRSNTVSVLLGNGDGTFQAQYILATVPYPKSVVVGDVNGDGKPDLVVALGGYQGTLCVLLGNGNGTFQPQQTFAAGNHPPSVVVMADLNGDGKPDLLVGKSQGLTVSVLLGNGNGTFQAPQTILTGLRPISVVVGDVNGDGKPDLAVANEASETVSILLGNGDGTFQAQQTFATGGFPVSVAMGDVNGDGKPDLAVVNAGSSTVSVLLGNGNGTFQAQQTFSTGAEPFSVALGDVNGDGIPDLAVANQSGNTVSVLLGIGNGTFQVQHAVATGPNPRSVVLGDVNGDGVLDLAVINKHSNTVSMLLGNGNGTFQAQQTFGTGAYPVSVALSDLNGDGKPDLIVANRDSNTVSVLLGNGNGTFQAQQTFAIGSYSISVVVGDLNGDGKPDLAVANDGSNMVSVLLGNGNGTFQAQQTILTGSFPSSVAVGDVNGDGKPDLAVAIFLDNTVSVLVGNGNGTFQAQQGFASGQKPASVVFGDVNGDGKADLIVANRDIGISVLVGNGNGTFQARQAFATGLLPSVVVGDVNGDGKADLAVANYSGTVSVLLGNGNGTFQAQQAVYTSSRPDSLALGDLNGDGRPDLVVANEGSNTVTVLLNGINGDFTGPTYTIDTIDPFVVSINRASPVGPVTNATSVSFTVTFSEPVTGVDSTDFQLSQVGSVTATGLVVTGNGAVYTATVSGIRGAGILGLNLVDDGSIRDLARNGLLQPNTTVHFQSQTTFATGPTPNVAIADVNGDGKADLVVANFSGNTVGVLLGNGNGTFQSLQTFAAGFGAISIAVADVNGDGKPDLVACNFISNNVGVLLGNGNGAFQAQQTFAADVNPLSMAVADVNGDGKPDLVVTTYRSMVGVLLGNGDGTFQTPQNFAAGGYNSHSVAVADFNGDGKPDIVAANLSANTVGVLLGNGDGTFNSHQIFSAGPEPTSVAAADVNGDGKPDLVVANGGNNTVGVLLGNGNGTFHAQKAFNTGVEPLSVTVADVNGDGKPDLVVVNYFSDTVSVLLGNGNGTFQVRQTLATGQGPVSATVSDINGDGKPDVVVANQNDNTLGVLLNSANGDFTGQTYTIVDPAAATHFVISGPSSVTAGQLLTFVVTAEDQYNETSYAYTGTVHFSSNDPKGFLEDNTTLTAGTGSFGAFLETAGTVTITATDTTSASITGSSPPILVSHGTLTHFGLAAPGSFPGLEILVTVTAEDAFNNAVTDYNGTVNLTSSDTGAVFNPQQGQLQSGQGTFGVTLSTVAFQSITANDIATPSIFGTTTVSIIERLTHLQVNAPTNVAAGTGFLFTVSAEDGFNNVVTSFNGTLGLTSSDALAVAAGSFPSSGTIISGKGVFAAVLKTAGSQSLSANSGFTPMGSASISVSPASATHFAFAGPTATTAGQLLIFTLTAEDPFNNVATGYNGTVLLTSTDNQAGLTFDPTVSSGIGLFAASLRTSGNQTITATDTTVGTLTGTSPPILVSPGPLAHFGLAAPASAPGAQFNLTVTAEDAYHNAITNYTGTVSLTSSDTATTFNPQSGTLPNNGSGTFGITIRTVGIQTISATDSQNPSITGSISTVVPSSALPATHFAVAGTPSSIVADNIMPFTVIAEDQFNDPVTAYSGAVAFSSGDSAATLPNGGALTGGVGVFSATLITAGNQTLTVTAAGPNSITGSATVGVKAAFATQYAIITRTSTATAGVAFVLGVIAEDQFGNTATGYSGIVHFSETDLQAVLPADTTLTSGVGFFPVMLKTAGSQIITATDTTSGNITGTSNPIVVSVAPASHFAVSAVLPTYPGVPVGPTRFASTGMPVRFTVTALDPFGNAVPQFTGTVHLTSSDSAAILPGEPATLVAGLGIFSATLMTPGNQTLAVADTISGSAGTSGPLATRGLVVTSFTPSLMGFTVAFNKPFNSQVVNLYTAGALPDDVILATTGSQVGVRGSVVFDASDTSFTFVKTDTVSGTGAFNPASGLLAAGKYTLTLRSFGNGSSGFEDALGGLLDGTNSGSAGDNFQVTFSVGAPLVAVGIPDFARGFSNTDAITLGVETSAVVLPIGAIYIPFHQQTIPFALAGTYMKASSQDATQITLVMDFDAGQAANFDADLTMQFTRNPDGTIEVSALARQDESLVFSLIGPNGETFVDNFEPGASFTYPSPGFVDGGTFTLTYTNPAVIPATGNAVVTYSGNAATLQSNIQAALNTGGLARQIGIGPGGVPNAVVVVTSDINSGAIVLVTFQNALAQATSRFLASNTSGVAIARATVDVANNIPGSGIPIALSGGIGMTSASFTLQYNPSLLSITGALSKIAGASFTLVANDTVHGIAVLSLSSSSRISANGAPVTLGTLLASVPGSATANYGATQLVHFSGVRLNGAGGPISAISRDAVQVAAYFGDVLGAGGGPLSLLDAVNIAALAGEMPNTAAQTIPGFAAFPNLDPAIIGDVSLQGSVNFTDAGAMTQEIGGTQRATIPYVPVGLQQQLTPGDSPGAVPPALHSPGMVFPIASLLAPQQPTVIAPIAPVARRSAVEPVFAHPEQLPTASQDVGIAETGLLLDAEFFTLKPRGSRRRGH